MPEIKRIDKSRNVPKAIKRAQQVKRIQIDSKKKKEENVIKHSKPDSIKRQADRVKHIIAIDQ